METSWPSISYMGKPISLRALFLAQQTKNIQGLCGRQSLDNLIILCGFLCQRVVNDHSRSREGLTRSETSYSKQIGGILDMDHDCHPALEEHGRRKHKIIDKYKPDQLIKGGDIFPVVLFLCLGLSAERESRAAIPSELVASSRQVEN